MKLSDLVTVSKLSGQLAEAKRQLNALPEAMLQVNYTYQPDERVDRHHSGGIIFRDAKTSNAVKPAFEELLNDRIDELAKQLADLGVDVGA